MNTKGKGKRKWKFSQKARFSMLKNEKVPSEDLKSAFPPSSSVMNYILMCPYVCYPRGGATLCAS